MQHSRINLSVLQHQSTSEEKHGRLLKRGSGDCRTFSAVSLKQLTTSTLYLDGRLTGFAKATKTSEAAKVY